MATYYPAGGERLTSVFGYLQGWGIQDFFLPFFLFFALIFAVLQKISLFTVKEGNDVKADRKINAVIAGAISAVVVVPHVINIYPVGLDPISMLFNFLPLSTIAFLVLILGLMVVGLASKKSEFDKPSAMRAIVGLLSVVIVLISFINYILPSLLPNWLWFDSRTLHSALAIAAMLLVVYLITSRPSQNSIENTARKLREFFGGT